MQEYWIDESDQFYPQIKHVSQCSRPEFVNLMTFTEAKQELIRGAQSRIDFWRGQIKEWRSMRKSDIPVN